MNNGQYIIICIYLEKIYNHGCYMVSEYIILRSLISLLLIVATASIVYYIAGIIASKGKHTELARKPFTGGVFLPQMPQRYFTDMVVFVALFLLSESIAMLVFLEASDPFTALILLLGSIGVFLPAIASLKKR